MRRVSLSAFFGILSELEMIVPLDSENFDPSLCGIIGEDRSETGPLRFLTTILMGKYL